MNSNFGFGPGDPDDPNSNENNLPDFNELFAQLSSFGLNPQTLFAAANSAGSVGPLISPDVLRDVARKFISSQGDRPIGSQDVADSQVALDIANTWLDEATNFPALSRSNLPAWSRRDWLDASVSNWAMMIEPLADGMANALTTVLKQTPLTDIAGIAGIAGVDGIDAEQGLAAVAPIMRAFMGSLIANQLGTSIGQLAVSITGSNDVAIPLFGASEARLIPENISNWAAGLDIPIDEVRIFLAVREAAASRLFSHSPWLSKYIQDAITAYGAGIKIDIDSIQEQAERALETGELDINNPESISTAISAGLFKPEQSPSQDAALEKLEMILALIEGWIDYVSTKAVGDRLPSYPALSETLRRGRATKSPTQQLFATLLGLEVSPRKMRECSLFWFEVENEIGLAERDQRWEDPALLPRSQDLADVVKFLTSTIVPDDLSGLL
ncbi:MAG: zinc-dependent metalloprotease [Actinomycetes bacterium]